MKRVRKYTYLPQEEIEVIETKSGQTIKSKEILDGNYVKAKPAAKKVVKKAVKKVVRKKYDDGGVAEKEYFNKGVIDVMVEDFIKKLKMKGINATKRASKNGVFVYGEKLGSGYKYETYISYSEVPNKEFLDFEMSEFIRLHKNKKKDYSELPLSELDKRIIRGIERDIEENPNLRYDDELFYMAKGGKTPIVRTQFEEEEFEYADGGKVGKVYKLVPMKPYGVKGMITADYEKMESFSGTEDDAVARAKEMAASNPNFVRVEVKLPLKTKTNTIAIVDGQNKEYADGGMMANVPSQIPSRIVRNAAKAAKEENRDVKIYYSTKYKQFHYSMFRAINYNDVLAGVVSPSGEVIKMPMDFAKTDDNYFYNQEDYNNYISRRDEVLEETKLEQNIMADGGRIKVGTFDEQQIINKEDKKAVEKAQEETGLKYVDVKFIKKKGKMYSEIYLIPNEEYYNSSKFADGGMMAKGGKRYEIELFFKGGSYGDNRKIGKYVVSQKTLDNIENEFSDIRIDVIDDNFSYNTALSLSDKKITSWDELKKDVYSKGQQSSMMMADGGKVTDKEVAESNVEMLHSNIKSIKHHAEELEHAIKDNTEVEGWVLAKADRAATAMSDITHYLDGRKMGRGGMVAGHYYKDKAGSDLRYIGPDSKNDDLGIFKDGEKYLTKSFNEFEEEKEKKSFWFGNGGFMPSGFSRKVTLSEKAEEMVGKNTWHVLDAAQKGEVIGELISDGALAVTMDRGGIVDADDWSKSMTQDKIYALKKAGYSENIASEMSLLPYEQLPMWVRQDFKKGSIVIGAYHIHKNDNIPVDGKVLVLNGDEEVVYSAETLDQAQEWAINQMQEVEDEDDGNYIYVSDCCGAEAGSSYDIGICPMCREHCEWEKESTYADGGVTEATKFKVVYKLRDAAEPKEKLFDNAENAEFFLETIKEDDDIMSANLVEVKPMKKAAEKKAPTNLFAAAKPAAASSASKKTKEDVLVPGIADRIARYDALKAIIKNAEAEKEVIGGALKEVGKEKFLELYELRRRNPETFNLADEDEKIMFIVMDKYIKVEPEKAGMLENYPGLLETTTTYKFNPALLDKTGEIVSRLILESTELSDDEKANLIVAETKIGIKSGSIDRLMDYDNPSQIFDLIEPILALK